MNLKINSVVSNNRKYFIKNEKNEKINRFIVVIRDCLLQ